MSRKKGVKPTLAEVRKMKSYYMKGMSSRQVAKIIGVSDSTVRRYIECRKNRGSYTYVNRDLSPLTDEQKKIENRKKSVIYVTRRRNKVKQMAVNHLGGKCVCCGYHKYIGALEFHHLDPAKKDFSISVYGHSRSWERVRIEIEKCVLVCSNCHREIHAGIIQLNG